MNNIALIGPMGAGKSTVGAEVARVVGARFCDVDALVAERAGMSISDIFTHEGEDAFRALESICLLECLSGERAVVACGGGVTLDPANIEALRDTAKVIYLKVDAQIAWERVKNTPGRPLLADGEAITLAKLIDEREEGYKQAAHHELDASGPLDEVVRGVLAVVSA